MNNSNDPARLGGLTNNFTDDDALLHEGGVLPKDFPQRLERLKEASGLSWGALARAIGVDRKSLIRWRKKGVEPCGGAMHAIFRLRGPDARRPGDPHGRGSPDEPLREGTLDQHGPAGRRTQAQRRHGGTRQETPSGARPQDVGAGRPIHRPQDERPAVQPVAAATVR